MEEVVQAARAQADANAPGADTSGSTPASSPSQQGALGLLLGSCREHCFRGSDAPLVFVVRTPLVDRYMLPATLQW